MPAAGLPGRSSFLAEAAPWSALVLRPGASVLCRKCKAVIVEQDNLKEWKDLPSENWAEMMEFWHCHKPDHAHAHNESLASRGYGANSRISAQDGVGFVNLTSFLLSKKDVSASTVSASLFDHRMGI